METTVKRIAIGRHGDTEAYCIKCESLIPLHGLHWVQQVCPNCLAVYFCGFGADYDIHPSAGFFPEPQRSQLKAQIAADGGRYIPRFN